MSRQANRFAVVGTSLPGVDSRAKLTGAASFTGDIALPDMLHGKILRSPHAHARIRAIDVSAALAIPGVAALATTCILVVDMGGDCKLRPLAARFRLRLPA